MIRIYLYQVDGTVLSKSMILEKRHLLPPSRGHLSAVQTQLTLKVMVTQLLLVAIGRKMH